MGNIIIPKKQLWVQKPELGSQINWGHPLSKGLVGCWLMNEGGGNKLKDLLNSTASITNGTWKSTIRGVGNLLADDGSAIITGGSSAVLPNSVSVIVVADYQKTSGIFSGSDNNTGCTYETLRVLDDDLSPTLFAGTAFGATDNLIFSADKSSLAQGCNGSTTLVVGKFYTFAGTFQYTGSGNHAGNWDCYVNGKKDNTSVNNLPVAGIVAPPFANKAFRFGRHPQWGGGSGVTFNLIYIYNRALSPSEIQSLYVSPYQFVYRPSKKMYFVVGGGGAVNVTVTPAVISNRVKTQSPTVAITNGNIDITITPNVINNRIVSQAPTIRVSAIVATNTITTRITLQSPTVRVTAVISTNTQTAKLTINSATIRIHHITSPATARVRLTTNAPTIVMGGNIVLALNTQIVRMILKTPTYRIITPGVLTGIADTIIKRSRIEQVVLKQSRVSQVIAKKSRIENNIIEESQLH